MLNLGPVAEEKSNGWMEREDPISEIGARSKRAYQMFLCRIRSGNNSADTEWNTLNIAAENMERRECVNKT
jgi:hypothetical protein